MTKRQSRKKELTPEELGALHAQRVWESIEYGKTTFPFQFIFGASLDETVAELIKTGLRIEDMYCYLPARDIPEFIFKSTLNDIVYLWGDVGILTTKTALREVDSKLKLADLYHTAGHFYPCARAALRPKDRRRLEEKYNITLTK